MASRASVVGILIAALGSVAIFAGDHRALTQGSARRRITHRRTSGTTAWSLGKWRVMIEAFMFFALGFLTAGLLALVVGRLKRRATPYLRDINDEFSVKTGWLPEAEHPLADQKAAKLDTELDDRSRTADAQRIEIVALKIQIDALKGQVAGLGKHRSQERIDPERRRTTMHLLR
jgi:hypothetical protein